jgi:hypothetical protein
MKSRFVRIISSTISVATLVILAPCIGNAQNENAGGQLVGTWDVAVTVTDCGSGNTITSFASLATIMRDGISIGSTAGMPQASRTPEHGVWRHVEGRNYVFGFKSFNFDPAGDPAGWAILKHDLALGKDGDSYTSSGIVRIYAPNGIQVAQGCSSAIGTRLVL